MDDGDEECGRAGGGEAATQMHSIRGVVGWVGGRVLMMRVHDAWE